MSSEDTKSDLSWLDKYYERGFRLVFYDSKQKGPSGPDAQNWTARADTKNSYKKGMNVGIFTGVEISPDKFLVDVDFDYPDGLPLAKHILPPTSFGFGRHSRTMSHAFYTTSKAQPSLVFEGIDGKPIVELRGTKQDGSIGQQTMAPPSTHPTGEVITLRMDGEIGHSDELPRLLALYATACLLYSNFADRSFLHDSRLATAGFLLTEGLSQEEVLTIGTAICEASGNSSVDFALIVKTTKAKIKSGDRVAGKTNLIKILTDGGANGKDIITKIKSYLGCSEFIMDMKGKPIANHQENIKIALDKIGVGLSYDLFAKKPMVEYPTSESLYVGPLADSLVNQAWLQIDEQFHFRPDRTFFNSVVDNICIKNKFHPVLDYLKGLTWDGVPRIDTWLIKAGGAADTDYVRAVSSIMLMAAVKRVVSPGCKYDEMVVLESAQQGLMKSTALRTLCPDERWFSDDLPLNVDAKQIVERTLGKWIIEASDLSGMRPASIEHLKGMLSRQVDGPVRLAYARIPEEQPRQFIITGTTNSYTYLTDSTGNRRFWPIRIKAFDVSYIRENRDLMWAEAYSRILAGESIRLDPKLYGHASLQQERRRSEDPWEVKLEETYSRDVKHRLAPDDIWGVLGLHEVNRRGPVENDRMLKAMTALGFRRLTIRQEDGKAVKGFGRDVLVGQQPLEDKYEEL